MNVIKTGTESVTEGSGIAFYLDVHLNVEVRSEQVRSVAIEVKFSHQTQEK